MSYLRNLAKLTRSGMKPISERRLHNRARALWQAARRGQEFPCLEELDHLQINDISEHGFILQLRKNDAPLIVQAGEILLEEARLEATPVSLAVISDISLLGQFGSRWPQVVLAREPMTAEYEFTTEQGYKIYCRGILLPLAADGETIDQIYGVVNWKSKKLAGSSVGPARDCPDRIEGYEP